ARTTNPQVKEVANQMIADHEANLNQIKQVAAAKNISIPTSPTEDALEASKKWNDVNADKFDKDYISSLVKHHKDQISDFESKMNSINDVDIKNYISNSLTKLRQHYDKVVTL